MGYQYFDVWNRLHSDLDDDHDFPAQRPILAHYSSIATLEKVFISDEVWLSNPLNMNDVEELRFGLNEAAHAFYSHDGLLDALKSSELLASLQTSFQNSFDEFDANHAIDTYVLCFSEHSPGDTDGLLSMWRGYGVNGAGAAIVIDTEKLQPMADSPIIFSKVEYMSRDDRRKWIKNKIDEFSGMLAQTSWSENELRLAAFVLLERFKLFALTTKDKGFREEREWRFIYFSQRDPGKILSRWFGYQITPKGVEPKLKLPLRGEIEGVLADNVNLAGLVTTIILGPSHSSQIALSSFKRMLQCIGKPEFAERVVASTTPYRST
ncbi:MAG: DUF2971 domain-containing protein [Methylophilaceae bacterium]